VLELVVVLLLVLLNGIFALSELSIVSARKARLKSMAEAGRRGARAALALAEDPGRLLSTVVVGITLIGIIAGAYSGATLGAWLSQYLAAHGVPEAVAEPLGLGLVIGGVTYFSVVIGELVPKHFALRNAEAAACLVAPAMALIARLVAPVVWFLDASTRVVLRAIGQGSAMRSVVTDEEIKALVAEAASTGVIEAGERHMISGVMRLGDRAVRQLMTPRTSVEWINLSDDDATIRAALTTATHTRLPVTDGNQDNIVGVINTRELLASLLKGIALDIRAHMRKAPVVPDTLDALDVLGVLKNAEVPMALVHDEYGHFEGIVTPADALQAIIGTLRSDAGPAEERAVRRDDGTWLLEGAMPADEMAERLGIRLPDARGYDTVAGFVISEMQHLPSTGERIERQGWRFEVVDLDGRRIDKVLASPVKEPAGS
jgi:putative hemolysin